MVPLIQRLVPTGEFRRGVVTLVAGTGIAQIIVIASSPVLTRLYSPADFGVFAVGTSIVSVLIAVTCLRYEFAVTLPDSDVAAANVLAVSLIANVVMSAVVGFVLWLTGSALLGVFGASVLVPYIPLITLGQLGGGSVAALTNWAIRTKSFSHIAATRLTQSVSLVAVQIAFRAVGSGAPGLLLGDVAGRVAGLTRLSHSAWGKHASAFRAVSRAGIRSAAVRYRRFPLYSGPSALLTSLAFQAPVLLLVLVYGPISGGQYALAERACSIPLTLVAGAVGQVFLSRASDLARESPEALRVLFIRTTSSLIRSAIVPAALLAVAAPFLAAPVFGDAWHETGLFIAILAPMYCIAFAATATGDILYVLERQDLQLAREALRLGLLGGTIPLAGALHQTPIGAVIALSIAGSVTYSLYWLISWRAITSHRPPVATAPVRG
jgi:O-antigen/teichoic acid export membrane protein